MIGDHISRASVCPSPLTSVGIPPPPPRTSRAIWTSRRCTRTAPWGWAAATTRLMASTPAARQSAANSAPDHRDRRVRPASARCRSDLLAVRVLPTEVEREDVSPIADIQGGAHQGRRGPGVLGQDGSLGVHLEPLVAD